MTSFTPNPPGITQDQVRKVITGIWLSIGKMTRPESTEPVGIEGNILTDSGWVHDSVDRMVACRVLTTSAYQDHFLAFRILIDGAKYTLDGVEEAEGKDDFHEILMVRERWDSVDEVKAHVEDYLTKADMCPGVEYRRD